MRQYPNEYFLGFVFGISQSTTNNYLKATLELLYNYCLKKRFILVSSRKERDKMSQFMREVRISAVIDGSEQQIKAPMDKFQEGAYYSGNLNK